MPDEGAAVEVMVDGEAGHPRRGPAAGRRLGRGRAHRWREAARVRLRRPGWPLAGVLSLAAAPWRAGRAGLRRGGRLARARLRGREGPGGRQARPPAAAAPAPERRDTGQRRPWLSPAIGLIAGLASGLLGVGGGFLIVPLQIVWAKRGPHRATGTSLAAILPIALVGAARYYFGGGRRPQVDVAVALLLVLGSGAGAYLGARAIHRVPRLGLQRFVAVILSVVGAYQILGVVVWPDLVAGHAQPAQLDPPHMALVAAAGAAIGLVGGLTGVGGGVFLVPTMVLGFGLSQHLAQGTSLVAILPTAAVGALMHHRRGNVDVRAAALIGGVGAPAALLGASLALALPQTVLILIFGAFLVAAATRMWPGRARA